MNGIVIIPTYNEAANLEPLIYRILSQPVGLDIVVVDDNSPDGTGDLADRIAKDWAATFGRVSVLHRPGKEGLGRAYLAGFAWALTHGYELLIEMDADLSHDPLFLPALIEASDSADVVLGSRYVSGISVVNWPLHRILLSWGANQYVRCVTGLPVQDATSGFRLYKRQILETMDLPSVVSNGYSFQVEMAYRAMLAGARIAEVPIIFTERRAGCSKMSRRVIWESVWVPLQLRLEARALRAKLGTAGPMSAANLRKAA